MLPTSGGRAALLIWVAALTAADANTTITFTRGDIATMAVLWETDCVSVSSLANEQYPNVAGTWDYIVPHTSISSDGDIHIDMAIDASGTGASSNNYGKPQSVGEWTTATQAHLIHPKNLRTRQAPLREILRFTTHHPGHPPF